MTEDKRISDIISRVEELTVESRTLTQELRQLNLARVNGRETPSTVPARAPYEHEFEIGDRVKITNKYRKQNGTIGTVTNVTSTQVTIIDSLGQVFKRKYTNIQKV